MAAEIDAYRSAVVALIETDSSQRISNGKSEHAAVLYECFFKYAKKRVLIFCDNLAAIVFNSTRLVEEAKCAIEQGVEIFIVTKHTPEDSEFLRMIRDTSANGLVKQIVHPHLAAITFNFAVSDGKRYRFEQDHNQPSAVACMNDPKFAAQLEDLFCRLQSACAVKGTA